MPTTIARTRVQDGLSRLRGLGWTHAAIADALDVSHNTIDRWRSGSRRPPAQYVDLICEHMAVLEQMRPPRRWRRKAE